MPASVPKKTKRRSKAFIAERDELKKFSMVIDKIVDENSLNLESLDVHAWKKQIRKFELVVMGMYNAGKSTLLNLLLNLDPDNGLPTGHRPTTNKLWKISYSSRPQLKAMRFDRSKADFVIVKKLTSILDDLESKYSARKIASIDYYELGLPSEWLKRTGWTIWDTPGKDDLGGLLDEYHFERVLQAAEGAFVVTNYDQHRSCSEYLLQLKSSHIECVVICLTNSAARSPDEFTAAADRHLNQVTDYLRDHFPAARFHFAIDSKDPSGSLDRMQNRWLETLWSVTAAIEEVEESLILLRAWRSLEAVVAMVEERLILRISHLQEEAALLATEVARLTNLTELPISSPSLRSLNKEITADLKDRIGMKSANLRREVEEILQAAKEAQEPGLPEKAWGLLSFGYGGRSEDEIDRNFMEDLRSRLLDLGNTFIWEKVWEYIVPHVEQAGTYLANQEAENYLRYVGTKHRFSYCANLKSAAIDKLYEFAITGFALIEKDFSKPGFRKDQKLKSEFLNLVEGTVKEIFYEAIQYAVRLMVEDIRNHYENLRDRACVSLQKKIEEHTTSIAEIESRVLHLSVERNHLHQLSNQLKIAVKRHQHSIHTQ